MWYDAFMKKNDWKIIFFVLMIAAVLFILQNIMQNKQGTYVEVCVDGVVQARYPLSEDTDTIIQGINHLNNHLVIKNGQADITDAGCPDKLCVHQKKISKVGETLVCLPNRVVITVKGSDSSEHREVDSIAK